MARNVVTLASWLNTLILTLLIATCILAITLMVRLVSRPSLTQALRLSED